MKKYKLKKDTPTIKAGTIFQRATSKYNEPCELMYAMLISGDIPLPWRVNDITNFDEWFEEVEEFEESMPRHSEQYKCINEDGVVVSYYNDEDGVDRFNFSIGNCYPLNTPDGVIIKEQKLIPQAMHRLKMAAKKAWFEFNGSEGPDWSDDDQEKWTVHYDHSREMLTIEICRSIQCYAPFYFPTEESCQAYIDNNQDDLKLLFGVE